MIKHFKILSKREQFALIFGGAFLIGFIFLKGIIVPLYEKRETFKKKLIDRTIALSEMIELKHEYDTLQKTAQASRRYLTNRPKNFSLFSFLDQLAGEVDLKKFITYMKPSTSKSQDGKITKDLVEMKLKAINMKQLVTYLYRVETSQNMITIKGLSIIKIKKPAGYIDAVIKAETITL